MSAGTDLKKVSSNDLADRGATDRGAAVPVGHVSAFCPSGFACKEGIANVETVLNCSMGKMLPFEF